MERKLRAKTKEVEDLRETLKVGRSEKSQMKNKEEMREDEHRLAIEQLKL